MVRKMLGLGLVGALWAAGVAVPVHAALSADQIRVVEKISQCDISEWGKLLHENHRNLNSEIVAYLVNQSTLALKKNDDANAFYFALLADMTAKELHEPIICRLALADTYWKRGAGTQAFDVLENILITDPHMAEPWILGGNFLMQAGSLDDARIKFEKALTLRHDSEEALQHVAEIYLLEKKLPEAIKAADRLLVLYPNNAKGREIVAKVKQAQQISASPTTLVGTYQADPQAQQLYIDGKAKSFAGQLPQAEAEVRQAVEKDAKFTDGWNLLGDILMRESKWEDAAHSYEQAVALAPQETDAVHAEAVAYEKAYDEKKDPTLLSKAIDAYGQAALLAPDNRQFKADLLRVNQKR